MKIVISDFDSEFVPSQDDLSTPLVQENLDGSSGVLFPFYDPDTHMLYIAGKVCLNEAPLRSYTSYKALQHLLTVPARAMETYGTTRSARRNRISTT